MKTEPQIMHFRKRNGDQRGGLTVAIDYNHEERAIYVAEAKCSRNDMFNRKLGRTIATGRLQAFFDGRSNIPLDRHILARIEIGKGEVVDPRKYKEMTVRALSSTLKHQKLK